MLYNQLKSRTTWKGVDDNNDSTLKPTTFLLRMLFFFGLHANQHSTTKAPSLNIKPAKTPTRGDIDLGSWPIPFFRSRNERKRSPEARPPEEDGILPFRLILGLHLQATCSHIIPTNSESHRTQSGLAIPQISSSRAVVPRERGVGAPGQNLSAPSPLKTSCHLRNEPPHKTTLKTEKQISTFKL